MRPAFCFLGILYISLWLASPTASAGIPFPVPPFHPTIVLVEQEGTWLPVYHATTSGKTIVKVEGKTKTLATGARLRFKRANSFAPGFVNIRNNYEDPIPVGTGSYVRGLVKSDRAYTHCMAVMIAYSPNTREPVYQADIHIACLGIPDLKVGKETRILVNLPELQIAGAPAVLLLFSEGQEIQTTQSDAAGAFFRRLEVDSHERVLRDYREKFQHADHAAQVYLRFPPVFPEDLDLSKLPEMVHLSLVIGRDGIAEDLHLAENLPQAEALPILRAVGGWLFVPQLKAGFEQAVPKQVILQLREPTTPAPKLDKPADLNDRPDLGGEPSH
jgi:hypothetical protein